MTKWIATFIMMVIFVFFMTNKKMELQTIFNDYQYSKKPWVKELHVDRGREIMRARLLPYVLDIYSTGRDIEFAAAMVAECDGQEGTARLWKFIEDPKTDPFTRTICMAHLLSRDQLRVWSEITEADIELISASVPAHVVHWKTLLLKYTGGTQAAFKNDTFPERHKFKALFRECIQMYTLKEQDRTQL